MIYTPYYPLAFEQPDGEKSTCTKIIIGAYEISIAMDQSLVKGNDLTRTEIKIYKSDATVSDHSAESTYTGFNSDVTDIFIRKYVTEDKTLGDTFTFNTSEHLFWIMQQCMENKYRI